MNKVLLTTLIISLYSCAVATKKERILKFDDNKKISLAVQTNNIEALKAIFSKLDKDINKRSRSDQGLINQAAVMTAAYGSKCNKDMINYLYTEGAVITYYSMRTDKFSHTADGPRKYKIPACGNYLVTDTTQYLTRKMPTYFDSQDDFETTVKANFIKTTHKYLVQFLNATRLGTSTNQSIKETLEGYTKVFDLASQYGKEVCKANASSEGCIAIGLFKNIQKSMVEKGYLNPRSKNYRFYKAFYENMKSKL